MKWGQGLKGQGNRLPLFFCPSGLFGNFFLACPV